MFTQLDNLVLKKINSDFCVNENPLALQYGAGNHHVYMLHKSGYTTHEAVKKIAGAFQKNAKDISYSGLKDEDGITSQLVSAPYRFSHSRLKIFNAMDPNINLRYMGNTDNRLEIGRLLGNSFKLIVRNLSIDAANKLATIKSHQQSFINYYGIQRFGIPNRKKTTPIIGQHLLEGDYATALELLIEQSQNDTELKHYRGMPKHYFDRIDPRHLTFYCSSYYSYHWNNTLLEAIQERYSSQNLLIRTEEGIRYGYLKTNQQKLALQAQLSKLSIKKYRVMEDKPIVVLENRSTVLNTKIYISDTNNDEFHPGKKRVTLDFLVPSSCYATVIVPQFFHEICLDELA